MYDLLYSEHDRQRQQAGYCCGPSYSCGGEYLAHTYKEYEGVRIMKKESPATFTIVLAL